MRILSNIFFSSYLLLFPLIYSYNRSFIESNIYYTAPNFDIKFANVTFGGSKPNFDRKITGDASSIGEALSLICQAELINQKKTQFPIDGIINLAFQDFSSRQSSGQAAILNLLSNSLSADQLDINLPYSINLTGLFGTSNFGTAKINSFISNFYGIPFVTATDLSRANPDNRVSGAFPAENKTFFQVLDTSNYNPFSAILQVLNHFNWTLVGNVFQDNNFGYEKKYQVMDYAVNNSIPNFACSTTYYFEPGQETSAFTLRDNIFKYYCLCIKEKNTIEVNVLWMSTTAAVNFITNLRENCQDANDWTFIIADDIQTPLGTTSYTENLNNSLLLRVNGPWDYKSFISDCLNYSSPQSLPTIKDLLSNLLFANFNCKIESDLSLKLCDKFSSNNEICLCDLDIFYTDPYITRLFFSADLLTTYAQGVSLLQNNCSLLTEKANEFIKTNNRNFCEKETFTPEDLTFALRFVNFTGYTGQINFPDNIMIRSAKSFFLYSVFNTTFDAVLVGILNETTVTINDSEIYFINNEVPTSKIVPQNPDLSYAVVDVFFSIAIVELIICSSLLILFIIYRKYRCIRRMSPLLSFVILFGLTLLSLSQLMLSFARTGTLCVINVYLTRMGLIILFSGLLFKYYRIYRIFANRSAVPVYWPEPRLALIILAGSIVYLGVITVFIAVFGYDAVLLTSDGNPYYQYVACKIPSKNWNTILELFMQMVLVILILISLLLVWLTRKVFSDYRDTRSLSAYLTVLTAVFIIFAPMDYTFGSETDSEIFRYVILVVSLTIIVVSGLAFLFIPKVFLIYKERKLWKSRRMSYR